MHTNFNPHFSGTIDESTDLYAFIDESGDEGFNFAQPGTSQWFNVSAVLSRPNVSRDMVQHVRDYQISKGITKPITRMDSKELKHHHKRDIFTGLSTFPFVTIHSLFYKPQIDPNDNLLTYPSMYFVGVKNVLERISWATQQFNKRKTHIIISSRNNIRRDDMKKYLFQNSVSAQKNLCYMDRLGIVKLSTFDQRPQLLFADYAAYTMRLVVEQNGTPPTTEPYYFKMFQSKKLFQSIHPKWGGVWRNGLKCTPDDMALVQGSDILTEGSHML